MKHLTKWSPDTCGCKLVYETDDEHPELDTKAVETIKACPFHEGLDIGKHFDTVLEENQRKNRFEGMIHKNVPEVIDTKIIEGKEVKHMKDMYQYKWSFDADRNLVVDVKDFPKTAIKKIQDLTKDQKIALQNS